MIGSTLSDNYLDNKNYWVDIQKNTNLLMLQFGPEKDRKVSKKKAERWIYFDSSLNEIIIKKNTKRKMLSKKKNKNKNEMIVTFLKVFMEFNKFNDPKYREDTLKELINERMEFIRKHSSGELIINPTINKFYKFDELLKFNDFDELLVKDENKNYIISTDYTSGFYRDDLIVADEQHIGMKIENIIDKEFDFYIVDDDDDDVRLTISEYDYAILNLQRAKENLQKYIDFLSDVVRIYLKIEWNIAKEGK